MEKTALLDYDNSQIQSLIHSKKWGELNEYEKIRNIYNFVRDEIKFGYNVDDSIPASKILADGYGQCNTKGILFMALLRAEGIPCRIHGFTVDKTMQNGAMTGLAFMLSPKELVHSWVEVFYEDQWFELEGLILDKRYLGQLQAKFPDCNGGFCGYGVATSDFQNPQIDWDKNNTYIQNTGIIQDFGVFDSPDAFFSKNQQHIGVVKGFLYRNWLRHLMNFNVWKIRH